MTTEIAAAASRSGARPIPPAQTHGGAFAVAPKWVPAGPYLPHFTPGLIYDFPDTSGMHDILTYEALQIAAGRPNDDPAFDPKPAIALLDRWSAEYAARGPSAEPTDWPAPIALHQPDDPGIDPPAMRSAWQDDEPDDDARPTHWAVAWFFIVSSGALAAIALWQAFPDFWRRS